MNIVIFHSASMVGYGLVLYTTKIVGFSHRK